MINDNFVAISSLESPEHATRKDPKIISAVWFLGKRCNYDCSYCSPFIHDNYSSHIDIEIAEKFVDNLDKHCAAQGKQFKLTITGGEPFVHPHILRLLQYIKNKTACTQLVVTTNGTLPLKMYMKSLEYITNLTVSLHLEEGNTATDETVDKIIKLSKVANFFNVNIMAVPGHFDKMKETIEQFDKSSVNYIIRKIDPPTDDFEPNKKTKSQGLQEDKNESYLEDKKLHKDYNNSVFEKFWETYYSQDEWEYLQSFEKTSGWNNTRLWFEDGNFIETNSDELKRRNQNNWQGWHCYIGIDSINIQSDGTVYRGYCMAGTPMGNINTQLVFPEKPIVCPLKWCDCIADMTIRKVKNLDYKLFVE